MGCPNSTATTLLSKRMKRLLVLLLWLFLKLNIPKENPVKFCGTPHTGQDVSGLKYFLFQAAEEDKMTCLVTHC